MSKPQEPTQFTRESAERIARVVRAAELAVPQARPLTFDRVEVLKNSKLFRVCTFTGAWSIGSAKTVTFRNVTSTPNTVSAVNLFFPVAPLSTVSSINCAVAKDGSQWYLVDVPMQETTGIFVSGTQMGLSVTGTAAQAVVTDVTLSAILNTSSCSIAIGKTLVTASKMFVTGLQEAVHVTGTYTAKYLRFGY
jgi:hypothetical protein